jgi:hypothetical protein
MPTKHASGTSLEDFASSSISLVIPRRHSRILLPLVSSLVVIQLIAPGITHIKPLVWTERATTMSEWAEPVTKPLEFEKPVTEALELTEPDSFPKEADLSLKSIAWEHVDPGNQVETKPLGLADTNSFPKDDDDLLKSSATKFLIAPENHVATEPFIRNEPSPVMKDPAVPLKSRVSHHTVFYNIYLSPTDRKLSGAGTRIVREQLRQLSESFAAHGRQRHGTESQEGEALLPLDVHYITIGAANASETVVIPTCKKFNLNCVHLNHYDNAHEEKALGALHKFCKAKNKRGEDHSVIYIHTKGSFHRQALGQDQWRRAGTAAVTSEFCVRSIGEQEHQPSPSNSSSTCNACGLLFQPLPGVHFPGNFFTAKCSYISQLLSPGQFNAMASTLKKRHAVLEESGAKKGNFYGWSMANVGFLRYANERKYHGSGEAFESLLISHGCVLPCHNPDRLGGLSPIAGPV